MKVPESRPRVRLLTSVPAGTVTPRDDEFAVDAAPEARAPLRVGLVGASDLTRHGLRAVLRGASERFSTHLVEVEAVGPDGVDLVLVDTHPGPEPAAARVRGLLARGYGPVAALGWGPIVGEFGPLRAAGARGYVSLRLDAADLTATLERLVRLPDRAGPTGRTWTAGRRAAGDCPAREAEILTLICQGLGNQAIADDLFISINTVKSVIRSLYRRIGVTTRPQAVIWGLRHGPLRTPGAGVPPGSAGAGDPRDAPAARSGRVHPLPERGFHTRTHP